MYVKPKKHFGQHFLVDETIAQKIALSLDVEFQNVLEIGPGKGVLTQFLLNRKNLICVEIDEESVAYLQQNLNLKPNQIIQGDFLRLNLSNLFSQPFCLIGNFPYNISSQIVFKILEHKAQIPQMVGMFQKEVADRIAAPHGSKTYGILSVLVQTFYQVTYIEMVDENKFFPPPKVKSAVIKFSKLKTQPVLTNQEFFFKLVKTAFNQRRKMISNSIKSLLIPNHQIDFNLTLRPEQISVNEFLRLYQILEPLQKKC